MTRLRRLPELPYTPSPLWNWSSRAPFRRLARTFPAFLAFYRHRLGHLRPGYHLLPCLEPFELPDRLEILDRWPDHLEMDLDVRHRETPDLSIDASLLDPRGELLARFEPGFEGDSGTWDGETLRTTLRPYQGRPSVFVWIELDYTDYLALTLIVLRPGWTLASEGVDNPPASRPKSGKDDLTIRRCF